VALIVAFGVNLSVFAATYDAAKAADARFVVGSDVRITPSVVADQPPPAGFDATLRVPGVAAVTPVVAALENAVLIGPFDQFREDLTAVDPAGFARVAPLADSSFAGGSARRAMAALAYEPAGVLVARRAADDLSIEVGDEVQILLARGTDQQVRRPFDVVGLFDELPGFPEGVDLVVDLATYADATGLDQPDFYLARTAHHAAPAQAQVAAALQAGPGLRQPLVVQTAQGALDKDQSSLAALDIHGLVQLDLLFALLMSAACMAIFVFGLLLQRRRELVTLRAQGIANGQLRALVLGEAGLVAVSGAIAGLVVGAAMAVVFVRVLHPLFVLRPHVTVRPGLLLAVVALPVVATAVSALVATAVLRRMHPTELLRET
jgi:putative ABC transport system permease protein